MIRRIDLATVQPYTQLSTESNTCACVQQNVRVLIPYNNYMKTLLHYTHITAQDGYTLADVLSLAGVQQKDIIYITFLITQDAMTASMVYQ